MIIKQSRMFHLLLDTHWRNHRSSREHCQDSQCQADQHSSSWRPGLDTGTLEEYSTLPDTIPAVAAAVVVVAVVEQCPESLATLHLNLENEVEVSLVTLFICYH